MAMSPLNCLLLDRERQTVLQLLDEITVTTNPNTLEIRLLGKVERLSIEINRGKKLWRNGVLVVEELWRGNKTNEHSYFTSPHPSVTITVGLRK